MRVLFAVLLLSCGGPHPSTTMVMVPSPSRTGLATWYHKDSAAKDNGPSRAFLWFKALPDGGSPSELTLALVAKSINTDDMVFLAVNGELADAGYSSTPGDGGTWFATISGSATGQWRPVVLACMDAGTIVVESRTGPAMRPLAQTDFAGGEPQRMREVLDAWKYFGGAW